MKALTEPLLKLKSFQEILERMSDANASVLATGLTDSAKAHIISALTETEDKSCLVITHSEKRAKELCADLNFYCKNAMLYPAKDILFYSADLRSIDIMRERFKVLNALLNGEARVVVLSAEALLDKLMKKEDFGRRIITIKEGETVNVEKLLEELTLMGYERCDVVEGAGQFAQRGGIIDIFSPTEENPFRIELWDDEIDSLKIISAESQRSIENTDKITVFPSSELIYDAQQAKNAVEKIEAEYVEVYKKMKSDGLKDAAERLSEVVGEITEKLREQVIYKGAGNITDFILDETASLLDYIAPDSIIFFDEPTKINEHITAVSQEYTRSAQARLEMGYILPSQAAAVYSFADILSRASKFKRLLLAVLQTKADGFDVNSAVNFQIKTTQSFASHFELFCSEVSQLKKDGYKILILSNGKTKCERIREELLENGIEAVFVENLENYTLENGVVSIARGGVSGGANYDFINLAVFSENELFGSLKKKRRARKEKKGSRIESFTDLKIGDYVVHDTYGIGVFKGLEKITIDKISKDYMKIEYAGGDCLFVPVNQMDIAQKYIGGTPKINKLGGQEWSRAKNRARGAVAIMAEELIEIYAKRQAAEGFVYSEDNVWQREFEETFPYEETDDQLDAIEDVKKDMQSDKVMDRLICGDVGYGKTEVAIRAAFKAVQDSKQVAFLAPTTILAQQHYNTFTQRMADYPIRIDLLSRFRTAAQQKATKEGLKNGYVDIVIGTHKLLSKTVSFKNLGLIIVDEEQRFGVSHKEKLKTLKDNADVITLTATPIPRTLHMSLSGIRDMSVLEEAPQERQPAQTYVIEENLEFIKEAIERELKRNGQVYYLHNRITTIEETTSKLRGILPDANIAFAHGKMSESELEIIMRDFIEGDIDVLVCTTIIETGLDIPNANTIIIEDADRMGLSQLYQLRGRVGRSRRRAYAYLLYKKEKALKEEAEKRLQTIREFTELGSGFKIAMRDLEIRGAGNLLGAQQHGHMESVGYDMYCKLLDEEIQKLKGEEKPKKKNDVTVDLNINAFIPDFYIKNEKLRLEMYKKISLISSEDEYFDVIDELSDRYGEPPKSVQTLLSVVLMKSKAKAIDIISVEQKRNDVILTFAPNGDVEPAKVRELVASARDKYFFSADEKQYITIKLAAKDNVLQEVTYAVEKLAN